MIDLHIHATDASDLYRQIRDLAGPAILEGYADEALLTEVRQRMAKKGLVVVVKPFEDGAADTVEAPPATEDDTTVPPKGRPGRKPRAVESPAPAAPAPEGPKPVEPASDTAKAMAEISATAIEDVKAALDAYAAIHGQMPAREIIKSVGGSARLMDVPPEKYGALVVALTVKVAA